VPHSVQFSPQAARTEWGASFFRDQGGIACTATPHTRLLQCLRYLAGAKAAGADTLRADGTVFFPYFNFANIREPATARLAMRVANRVPNHTSLAAD
jgi:hypothetical protein